MVMRVAGSAIVGFLAAASTVCAQDHSEWKRVISISPGTELRMETETAASQPCRLLSADDRGVTVVNTGDLPRSARRLVADIAKNHPEGLQTPGAMYVKDNVRIDRDGAWVGSDLVATRARLVERIDQPHVREIRYAGRGGPDGKRSAVIGAAAGAAAAYFYGGVWSCGQGAVVSECHGYGMLMMPVGAGAGAAIGYLLGEHMKHPSGIIYRRP
jgi:hypothetical protein